MSGNTYGKLFTVTTFGESHGPALGCIIDGCPPGIELSEADLQKIWIAVSQVHPGILLSVVKRMKLKFCLACLKVKPPVRRLVC